MEILNNNQISKFKRKYFNLFFILGFFCRSKSKSDENNNESTTKENNDGNQDQTSLRPSTIHTFAIGYLESLIQIRVCLTSKQKTLRFRQPLT